MSDMLLRFMVDRFIELSGEERTRYEMLLQQIRKRGFIQMAG